MSDPAEGDIEEKKRELQNSVATAIQEKMKRKDPSDTQRSKDLQRAILLLLIRSGGVFWEMVSFDVRCGNDDEHGSPTFKYVGINDRNVKHLINAIDEVVMARVFEVRLILGSGSPEGEGLALLSTIRERTEPRTIKLHLIAEDTPISVLTNNPTGKLSELPGVMLETLRLTYTCKDDNDNTSAIINYLNTSAMPPIGRVDVELVGCGQNGVTISDLVSNITQLSSLELTFNDNDEKSGRHRKMPDAAEWSKLAKLGKLKELKIICRSTEFKPDAYPKLPSWSEKSQSLETLDLDSVDAEPDFFSSFPQLTSLRIDHKHEITYGLKAFSTKTIEELIAEIRTQRGSLMNLESLAIHGPIIEKTGGSELIRDLCLAIVENYNRNCPKLQTLTLDFHFHVQGGIYETVQQFLSQKFDRQALSHAPLNIDLPRSWMIFVRQADGKRADVLKKIQSAIENLALAVNHSGLQFLALSRWEIFGCVVTHRELDDILEGIKVAHQRPDALLKNLEIVKGDDQSRTVWRVFWQNSNFEGFEQQIELTHWHWGHAGTIGMGPKGEREVEEEPNNSQPREAASGSEADDDGEESDVSKSHPEEDEEGSTESPSSGTAETESEMQEEPSQSDPKEDEEQSVDLPSSSGAAASEGREEGKASDVSLPETEEDDDDQDEPQLKRRRENDD